VDKLNRGNSVSMTSICTYVHNIHAHWLIMYMFVFIRFLPNQYESQRYGVMWTWCIVSEMNMWWVF